MITFVYKTDHVSNTTDSVYFCYGKLNFGSAFIMFKSQQVDQGDKVIEPLLYIELMFN